MRTTIFDPVRRDLVVLIAIILSMNLVLGQTDSIIVDDHIVLVGTVKKIDKGIITMDAEFTKNNIRVERHRIKSIVTQSHFMMTDKKGVRNHGTIESIGKDSIFLITDKNTRIIYHWDDLYNLEEYRKNFRQRFSFSIDVGFSMAQANNLVQWSSAGSIGYKANNWRIESNFNGIISSQEETETIHRWEQNIEVASFLPKNWFIHAELGFLTSSEQKLDHRFVPRLGVGKTLIRLNEINWNITGGGNMNFEKFIGTAEDRSTIEAFFGTDLNLIDLGNIKFSNRNSVFKSVRGDDRWRFDTAIDLRYKLPLKLYLLTGFTYNYDSSPTTGVDGTDYVLRAGIGWEL